MDFKQTRICVPLESIQGSASIISEHFGRSEMYAVVHADGQIEEVFKRSGECSEDNHGHCLPVEALITRQIDVVLCKQIGRGALAKLMGRGIFAMRANQPKLGEALEALTRGHCMPLSNMHACSGHDH